MPYVLAAGSRTHPIAAATWYNTEITWGAVSGYQILNPSHALFTSYYGLGWMDLRGLSDQQGIDLEANARQAALANRAACAAAKFSTYQAQAGGWWGLSAGDSPAGYVARGPVAGDPDGTVWPMAALATITWLPDVLPDDLTRWRESQIWPRVAGNYGIAPFSLSKEWIGADLMALTWAATLSTGATTSAVQFGSTGCAIPLPSKDYSAWAIFTKRRSISIPIGNARRSFRKSKRVPPRKRFDF